MRMRPKQSGYGSKLRRPSTSGVLSAKPKKRGTELLRSNVGQKKLKNKEKRRRNELKKKSGNGMRKSGSGKKRRKPGLEKRRRLNFDLLKTDNGLGRRVMLA